MKRAGILASIASLKGEVGIGDFGKEAYQFIDLIAKAKFKVWQILPLGPLGYGNSPYQPYSSYAGDEIYISLSSLVEDGLIKKNDYKLNVSSKIDYEKVRKLKNDYLKEAYLNFKSLDDLSDFKSFKDEQKWLYQYAVFMTFKKLNHNEAWLDWDESYKSWIDNPYDISEYEDDIEYEMFVQYIFYKQWFKLKKYANDLGIEIMGDIPIYVGLDSCDVWANKKCFLLDDKSHPTFIAGVPPDYFSPTGQRWGNPIYDWDYLEENDFKFWIDRLRHNQKLFDIIRIDHFRAFDTYWKIPVSCETAVDGEWVLAPGYELFDKIYQDLPDINIVVEDLGDLREEVLKLRDHYHLSGMKIVQFELNDGMVSKDYNASKNTILYTGTHDNQTLAGWYKDLSLEKRKALLKYYQAYSEHLCTRRIIHHILDSDIELVIIPVQDVIGIDDKGRINTPGTIGSPNWEWKMASYQSLKDHLSYYKDIIEASNR